MKIRVGNIRGHNPFYNKYKFEISYCVPEIEGRLDGC